MDDWLGAVHQRRILRVRCDQIGEDRFPVSRVSEMIPFDKQRLSSVIDELGLGMVVLFGSYAKRRPAPGPGSDVDVAAYGCPSDQYWACYRALAEVFGDADLDLVRLEDADPLFRHEIMQSGRLLDGDPDLFYEYRAYAYRDFVDSADLFALEQTLFEKKMARIKGLLHDSP